MLGVIINSILIIAGAGLGMLFRSHIKDTLVDTLMSAMGLVVIVIGVSSAAGVEDIIAVVVCMALGVMIGSAIKLQKRIDGLGDKIRDRLKGTKLGGGQFGDALVTTTILFGVGTMAIMGSIEAGINHNYSILIAKGVIDMVSAIAFTAAMGIGVAFSSAPIFIWEGLIALLAGVISPYLGADVISSMSAVGGAIFIGMGLNMLNISKRKIEIGNMIPAIVLPIIYVPISNWLVGLF